MPPRSAISPARRRSSANSAGSERSLAGPRVDVVEQRVGSTRARSGRPGSAPCPRAGCRSSAMLSAISRAPASSGGHRGRAGIGLGRRRRRHVLDLDRPAAARCPPPATSVCSSASPWTSRSPPVRSAVSSRASSPSSASSLASMPSAASWTRATWSDASSPAFDAQLGGAALGGLEDQADLLGRPARQRDRRRVHARLELVGDAAQVLVDRGRVITAATRRKVPAFDPIPIHDCLRIGRAPSRDAGYGRYADPSGPRTTSPSRSSPASARSRRSPCDRQLLARQQRRDDPPARPAIGVLEAHRAPRRRGAAGSGPAQPAGHRTRAAERRARAADRRAELHHRLVERRRRGPPAASARARARASARGVCATPSRRESTRRTFVSTAATCRSQANDPTAAAVYGPTPGKRRQVGRPAASRRRPAPRSAAPARAGCTRARSTATSTSRVGASASAAADGKRASQRS